MVGDRLITTTDGKRQQHQQQQATHSRPSKPSSCVRGAGGDWSSANDPTRFPIYAAAASFRSLIVRSCNRLCIKRSIECSGWRAVPCASCSVGKGVVECWSVHRNIICIPRSLCSPHVSIRRPTVQ